MSDLTTMSLDLLLGVTRTAIEQSDFDGAERALREVTRRRPRDAEAAATLSKILLAKGSRRDALAAARRAVGLSPRSARVQTALGDALAAMGQIDACVRAYRAALAADPENPELMVALAAALERRRCDVESIAMAEGALRINPAFGPALTLLGQGAMQRGDLAEADRWLSRAIAESPPEAKAQAWHLLGAVREAEHRWDEAFQCHDRGNRVTLASPAARHMLAIDPCELLPHQFLPGSEPMLERWGDRTFRSGPPDPVFLVGFPRSGTTMMENVLGALPGTLTTDEEPVSSAAFGMAVAMCGNPTPAEFPGALDRLSHEQIAELRAEYWRSMATMVSPDALQAPLVVDKSPLRFLQALLLNLLFPQSRMIFVVRDPRDCCLSCFFQNFVISPSLVRFTTLETTGDMYASSMTFWMRARNRLTMPLLEIRYEDMVADFELHARRLVEFIGREWSDDVLRFHEKASGRAIRTPSYRAVTQKINTRAVGKWAHYEKHLGPLIERVRPFLEPLGYAE